MARKKSDDVIKILFIRQIFEFILVLIIATLIVYIFLSHNSFKQKMKDCINFNEIKQYTQNCTVYNLTRGLESIPIVDARCSASFYQLGLNRGFTFAIISIMNRSQNCSIVPLFVGNKTINLIDVNCVKNVK